MRSLVDELGIPAVVARDAAALTDLHDVAEHVRLGFSQRLLLQLFRGDALQLPELLGEVTKEQDRICRETNDEEFCSLRAEKGYLRPR